MALFAVLTLLMLPLSCQSVHLDIHIPLPDGCLKYYTLLANRLLRQASRPISSGSTDLPPAIEEVNLFSLHTPHITLYLADFDLEIANISVQDDTGAIRLNNTKVAAFLNDISHLNFTEIISGMECTLSYFSKGASNTFYVINGAFTMLPIEKTPCLQMLSDTVLYTMKSYLRQPVAVPEWVAQLPEPTRSESIYRSREYGSPNVLEGFDPHVTVGFDPPIFSLTSSQHVWSSSQSPILESDGQANILQRRSEAMNQWNDLYGQAVSSENCVNDALGIALGKVGVGGTVLADSIMGYWDIGLPPGD